MSSIVFCTPQLKTFKKFSNGENKKRKRSRESGFSHFLHFYSQREVVNPNSKFVFLKHIHEFNF